MNTILYLIMAEMPDVPISLDLFVSATGLDQAIDLWRDYYGIDEEFDVEDYRFRYVVVPEANPQPHAHQWHIEVAVTEIRSAPPEDWGA